MGYKAACKALLRLMEPKGSSLSASDKTASDKTASDKTASDKTVSDKTVSYKEAASGIKASAGANKTGSINILGDFNLAGEMWIIKSYLEKIGLRITAQITGDARSRDIVRAPEASMNIVQCAGSMTWLAREMEEKYGMPYIKISFFGLEDTKASIMNIAQALGDENARNKARELIFAEELKIKGRLEEYRKRLAGKRAAIYVGGGFKAISLIKQFADLGMRTVMVGTQTGRPEEYEMLRTLAEEDTVILDDTNPAELERFIKEKGADILVGGVKERPLAYKLGIAFCDHNHERKHPLCGFEGAVNFAAEVDLTINSPVWKFTGMQSVLTSRGKEGFR
jgi:nitrogenase molybdenum-cofactor synthesis protein NifE